MTAVQHYCDVCGEPAFTGTVHEYEYPRGTGEIKQDVDGKLEPGAGQCDVCGNYYCADCNGLINGVCPECLEDLRGSEDFKIEEEDEDDDYCPF